MGEFCSKATLLTKYPANTRQLYAMNVCTSSNNTSLRYERNAFLRELS